MDVVAYALVSQIIDKAQLFYNEDVARATNGTSAAVATYEARGAVVGNSFYLVGGSRPWHQKILQIYDMVTGTWSLGTECPVEYQDATVVASGNYIFVTSGKLSAHRTLLYRYDTTTGTWTARATNPLNNQGAQAAEFDGVIYLFGYDTYTQVGKYTVASDTWTTVSHALATRPALRGGPKAFRIGNLIWVFVDPIAVYDPATNTSTQKSRLLASASYGGSAKGSNDYIYYFDDDRVYLYDPLTDKHYQTNVTTSRLYYSEHFYDHVNKLVCKVCGTDNYREEYYSTHNRITPGTRLSESPAFQALFGWLAAAS